MQQQLDDIDSGTTLRSIGNLKQLIIDCAKNIKSNDDTFEISTLPSVADNLKDYMTRCIQTMNQIESQQQAFKDIIEDLEKEDEDCAPDTYIDAEEYVRNYENMIVQDQQTISETNQDINNLQSIIKPPEEEIQVETAAIQIPKDPVTKQPIKVAVKSTVCNHIYDKEGIEGYFNLKKSTNNKRAKIQCPQAGCTNKNMSLDELVLDDETNKMIQSIS